MKSYRYNNSHKKKRGFNRPKYVVCHEKCKAHNETTCSVCLSRTGRTKKIQKDQLINNVNKKKLKNKQEINLNDYDENNKYNIYKQRSKKLQPIKKDCCGKNSYFSQDFIGIEKKKKSINQFYPI